MTTAEVTTPIAADGLLAAGRHPLTGRIAARLRDRCGVETGTRLVIGVSGGADSVALLLAARALRDRTAGSDSFSVLPVCCHVHHGLREDAIEDQRFVEELCSAIDVPCVSVRINVAAAGGNQADAARTLRYEALADVARQHDCSAIAIAHHADDQFETILMNLCRGSGIDGLSGMRWRADRPDSVALVRPLLDSRHTECESLCHAAHIAWREDPTNRDSSCARARIRAEVSPVLDSLWTGAADRVTLAAELHDYAKAQLSDDVAATFGDSSVRTWPRQALQSAPAIVIAAGLRRAALAIDSTLADRLTQAHLLSAADAIGSADRHPRRFDWPGGLTLTVRAHEVSL